MRTNYEVQVYMNTNVELKSAITSPDTPVVEENMVTDTRTRKTSTVRSVSYCIFHCACAPRPTNYCERSKLSGEFNGTDFLYIYLFQAVRRAVNVLNVSTCI